MLIIYAFYLVMFYSRWVLVRVSWIHNYIQNNLIFGVRYNYMMMMIFSRFPLSYLSLKSHTKFCSNCFTLINIDLFVFSTITRINTSNCIYLYLQQTSIYQSTPLKGKICKQGITNWLLTHDGKIKFEQFSYIIILLKIQMMREASGESCKWWNLLRKENKSFNIKFCQSYKMYCCCEVVHHIYFRLPIKLIAGEK